MSKIINGYKKLRDDCISIRITTPTAIITDGDIPLVAHDTVIINQGDNIEVANCTFVVRKTGLYFVTAKITFENNPTSFRSIYLEHQVLMVFLIEDE